MTTSYCISVEIGPGSKLMGYYYMTDDVQSFSLPWADLPDKLSHCWFCQYPPKCIHAYSRHTHKQTHTPAVRNTIRSPGSRWSGPSPSRYIKWFAFYWNITALLRYSIRSDHCHHVTNYCDSKGCHRRNSALYYMNPFSILKRRVKLAPPPVLMDFSIRLC